MTFTRVHQRTRRAVVVILTMILTLALSGAAVAPASASSDVSAPVLVSHSLSSTEVNVATSPATVTARVTITDATGTEAPTLLVSHPSGQSLYFGSMQLAEGTAQNGTWEATIHIPTSAPAGMWKATIYPLSDTLGNSAGSGFTTLGNINVTTDQVLNSSIPTISGTPQIGSSLSALTGTWGPAPVELSYQWSADGQPITGATSKDLILTAAHVGKTITVTVTGTKTGYATTSKTSAPTAKVATGVLTSASPNVTGETRVGSTLTAAPGTWGPAPVELSYQWSADGQPITGATSSKFTLTAAQLGKAVTVTVTGTKTGYTTASKTSTPTGKISAGVLTSTTPNITGEARVGSTLTAAHGTWGPAQVEFSYQWSADGQPITGATSSKFTLTGAQLGKAITVEVTGTKTGYTTASKTSAQTAKVLAKAVEFTDVRNPGSWYYNAVYWMADRGITSGYSNGTFQPTRNITRGETAAFLQRYAAPGYQGTGPARFPDVPMNHNFFTAIDWATDNNVIRGYSDGTYKPLRNVTRGEVASLIYRLSGERHTAPAASPFRDMKAGVAHYEAVSWLNSKGLLNGYADGTIRPTQHITRAEFSAILYRYNQYKG